MVSEQAWEYLESDGCLKNQDQIFMEIVYVVRYMHWRIKKIADEYPRLRFAFQFCHIYGYVRMVLLTSCATQPQGFINY